MECSGRSHTCDEGAPSTSEGRATASSLLSSAERNAVRSDHRGTHAVARAGAAQWCSPVVLRSCVVVCWCSVCVVVRVRDATGVRTAVGRCNNGTAAAMTNGTALDTTRARNTAGGRGATRTSYTAHTHHATRDSHTQAAQATASRNVLPRDVSALECRQQANRLDFHKQKRSNKDSTDEGVRTSSAASENEIWMVGGVGSTLLRAGSAEAGGEHACS